jgi:haloalkane dehalogenase
MNTSIGIMKEGTKPWWAPLEKKGKYEDFIKNTSNLIKMGITNKEKITPELLKAYSAPFPEEKYYIGALMWPKDIPVGKAHPSAEPMLHVRRNLENLKHKDKILIWGLKDPIFPPKMIEWWKKIYPNIKVHKIYDASHFLQEDAPEQIIEIIQKFIKI